MKSKTFIILLIGFLLFFFSDLKSEASGKVSRKRLKKDAVPDALVDIVTKKRQKLQYYHQAKRYYNMYITNSCLNIEFKN